MDKVLRLAPLEARWFIDYNSVPFQRSGNPGMRYLTCVNHQDARYLTKNPWQRSIHIIEPPAGHFPECPCPFSDLRVILEEGDEA